MDKSELLKVAKPMLFNTDMVRAILDGRKTVTRRVIKPQLPENIEKIRDVDPIGYLMFKTTDKLLDGYGHRESPYYVNEILYVRETWAVDEHLPYDNYFYRADDEMPKGWHLTAWKPSIHMPKDAARIFLKVTNVRAERLQDMPHDAPLKEGIQGITKDGTLYKYYSSYDAWAELHQKHKISKSLTAWQAMPISPITAFAFLWNSTIKKSDLDKYGWDANPFCWTISFERIEVAE